MKSSTSWLIVLLAFSIIGASTTARPAGQPEITVWPLKEWAIATPESQGLSSPALNTASQYALKYGGGSGCIIRHGFLVKEWGDSMNLADIKSATKGSVGATVLGLAVDDKRVKLDDLAQVHYPNLGTEKPENSKEWLAEITIRQLATMTAGFDDGRPPTLVRRPGSGGQYSNDTANMLAELLTLRFHEDLREVFKRRIMDVIGASTAEWAWRENAYRPKTIDGLKSREFASGITITHRALARLGYLYLRGGQWNGRQVLSKEFVRIATQPTELPSFVPYYAFYWGSNGRGTYSAMPRDTFWALGLGDSFVVVCPSLDIVAVRLGVGSDKSRLPGDPDDQNWGKRVEGFFSLVVHAAEEGQPANRKTSAMSPFPHSPLIRRIEWAPKETIVRHAVGSDNWPLTWADDDALYGAYGDGNGFEPFTSEKLSLGFARIVGSPEAFRGENVAAPSLETRGDGAAGKKASGLLSVERTLWLWARNAGNAQLAWSGDHGHSWSWADWKLSRGFGCPTFANYGRDNSGRRDGFAYVISPDRDDAYNVADQFVLARVPLARIPERAAYEFFAGLTRAGVPRWSTNVDERAGVLIRPGVCYRPSLTFNAALDRFLLVHPRPNAHSVDNAGKVDLRFHGGLAVYESPEPWGPWSTVFDTDDWDVGPGDSASFPTKWISADGRTLYLVFSGEDSFSVRRATLVLTDSSGP